MSNRTRGYLVAIGATLSALALRLLLARWLGGGAPFLPFTLAVLAAALTGGWGPGLAATGMSASLASLLFVQRLRAFPSATGEDVVHVALFLTIGTTISLIGQALMNARQAAESSEQYLARILETTTSGILVLDRDGYITFANTAAARLFGLMPSHLVGRRYDDAGWGITSEGKPILPFQTVLRAQEGIQGAQITVRGADDRPIALSVNTSLLRDRAEEPNGVVMALHKRIENPVAS
jgi:PAS domain S-box-containing protein